MKVIVRLGSLIRDEEGATMVEYAIVAGFIAAVCVVAVSGLGQVILGLFERALPPWGG